MSWLTAIVLTVIPLVFLPLTQDFYETSKWYAVVASFLLILLVWSVATLTKRKLVVYTGKAIWPLALLAGAGGLSLFVASSNKTEAALSPFGPVLFAALAGMLFLAGSGLAQHKRKLITLLSQTISLLALITLFQLSGLSGKLFSSVPWLQDPLWTPAGSTLALLTLFALTLPILIEHAWSAHTHKRQLDVFFYGAQALLVVASGVTTLALALPKIPSTILPLFAGWQVMLEAFKQIPAMVVGVGPENFLAAFTGGRAASLNMTPVWNTRFLASASTILHVGTTTGILGLIAAGVFLLYLAPRALKTALDWSRLIAVIALFFVPPSVSLLVVCAMLLFASEPHERTVNITKPAATTLFALVGLCIALGTGYLVVRSYMAERTYFMAYFTSQQADGALIQRTGQQAILLNPFVARFHEAYAQTNLILAAAIAQRATTSDSLSDADRQVVTQLISQSVREGKIATQLAPTRVTSWETLARLYQNLIGIANGADSWAIASYQKALELDPTNSQLRLELGSIYVAQGNYDAAIAHFAVAAALKPDLANAHYNLAHAHLQKGNIDAARQSLLQTQALLTQGSSDDEQIARELEQLEAGILPTPTPTPVLSPPIELP